MTGSIPTRVFFRDLGARRPDEVQAAYQVCAAREMNFVDISPQQRAWFMGARSALAWVLGMPKGGRKIEEMMRGLTTPGVVALDVADAFMQTRRDVLAGISADGFNTGG